MTFRIQTLLAALAVLGVAESALAQPIPPPRRPVFSNYGNLYAQSTYGYGGYGPYGGLLGAGYGNYGWGGGYGGLGGGLGLNPLMQQQNQMLSQQLSTFNQNLTNFQTFLATGVNPNFPATGHAAVFNNLGHWYSTSGTGGGVGGYGGGLPITGGTAGIGYALPMRGANTATGNGGGAAARTAGTGIPIGGPRK